MASILVLGAGLNGLSTAMLLARDGHDVTVLERDSQGPVPTAHDDAGRDVSDADAAWGTWERRGVTQFRMLHLMLPRWRHVMQREIPEVLHELAALGAPVLNMVGCQPDERTGGRRDGDERFDTLAARRPVLETALARVAATHAGVTVRRGVAVTGLLTGPSARTWLPHVAGVLTEGGEAVRADLVVDSSGRRSPLVRWLEAIRARSPFEAREQAGHIYYGRYFRTRDGATPHAVAPLLQHHDSVSILTLPADNGTWGVGFVTAASDRPLRALRDPDCWDAALRAYPTAAHWAEGEPLTEIDVMAGLEDRRRGFVVDGVPIATGVVAVGDSWACTNPSVGRGASMGVLHACALRDTLRATGTHTAARLEFVEHFDVVTERDLRPIYDATLQMDSHRLAEMQADIECRPYETDDPAWAIGKAMLAASGEDPDILRGYASIASLLATPDEVLAEPGLFERVVELGSRAGQYTLPGPSRRDLLTVLSGTSHRGSRGTSHRSTRRSRANGPEADQLATHASRAITAEASRST